MLLDPNSAVCFDSGRAISEESILGRDPIEFRRHYDHWLAATKRYSDAWLNAVAGDALERERLPALLDECNASRETFKEDCVQFFRSPSL